MIVTLPFQTFRRGRLPRPDRALVMGVINVTPDSFSDGGRFTSSGEAVAAALAMVEDGADLLDIGGESTRPGSGLVGDAEELSRILPVVRELSKRTTVPLAIDTRKVTVASAALDAGADILNDGTALRKLTPDGELADHPEMAELAAREKAGVILMHAFTIPATRQRPNGKGDEDILAEVMSMLRGRIAFAKEHGISADCLAVDPGYGFGKRFADNARLLRHQEELTGLGYPVVAGLSRKSMIADALGLPVRERLEASLALALMAVRNGARVVRVHDVKATRRALDMVSAIQRAAGA